MAMVVVVGPISKITIDHIFLLIACNQPFDQPKVETYQKCNIYISGLNQNSGFEFGNGYFDNDYGQTLFLDGS